jgi:predicted dehydrogenase
MVTRREFLDTLAVGAAGLAISSTAKSYGRIAGANERLNFAVIGLNSRAYAHLSSLKANQDAAHISHVCDVESTILAKFAAATSKMVGYDPATERDFRKILEREDIDAITIATPDHWHAPMAILGLQAGKHVYVEKPCSHNPGEGALLVEAQKKYGKLVQMGTQQRSSPHTIEIVNKIHSGIIGRAYYAKCWYNNTRKSIALESPRRCPRRWIGTCGRGLLRASPTRTMFNRTTGTGSASGVPAKPEQWNS